MRCKIVRLTAIYNGSKQTISDNYGFEMLQMVSEPNIRLCIRENAGSPRGWIVKSVSCEIPYRLERGTKHSL